MMVKDRNIDLTISGRKCRIHNNDNVARSLEKGTNLIAIGNSNTNTSSWNDEDNDVPGNKLPLSDDNRPPLLVDRYDARTLLDVISLQQLSDTHSNIDTGIDASKCTSHPFKEDGSQEEIKERNFIRYGLCSSYIKHTLKKTAAEDNIAADGKESDTLDEEAKITKLQEQEEKEEEPFQLSEEDLKKLPKDIPLPKTTRHNNIMELTTSRIAANNQLEVFLKVKQASNPDFSFLNPSDDLHRYYLYLKEKHTPNKAKDEEEDGSDDSNTSGLAGLLGGYASSSDSSCSPEKKNDTKCSSPDNGKKDTVDAEQHTTTTAGTTDAKPASSSSSLSSEQDRKRKADRLERLRVWKESKLKEQTDDT